MKKLALGLLLAASLAGTAMAGNPEAPRMDPVVIEAGAASSSSAAAIVAILAFSILAAAVSN
ncbi:hypothetical protein [Mesobacterium pallidum]|uniref:hypothetical protein n=1 Tax=Mesobacterium pallidum TaxID=2872037 RepID=UPI001EE24190|nr:hypothetical protein [Mesobacterium pallidum]